jgi:hypothetical protein
MMATASESQNCQGRSEAWTSAQTHAHTHTLSLSLSLSLSLPLPQASQPNLTRGQGWFVHRIAKLRGHEPVGALATNAPIQSSALSAHL